MRRIVITLCGIAALAAVSSALSPAGATQPPLPLNGYQAPVQYGYGYGYGSYANPYAGYDYSAAQAAYGFVHPAYADPSGGAVMNVAYTRKDPAPPAAADAHGPIPAPAPPAVGPTSLAPGYGYGYYDGGCQGCNDCQPKHRSCLAKLFGSLFGCCDRHSHGCGNDCGHSCGQGCGQAACDDDCDD